MSGSQTDKTSSHGYREMTVARVREPSGADHVEVVFLESARFYKLFRTHPHYETLLERLQDASAKGRGVRVRLTSPHGDIIEDVQELGKD